MRSEPLLPRLDPSGEVEEIPTGRAMHVRKTSCKGCQ